MGMLSGPTFRAATSQMLFETAMSQPLSVGSTLLESGKSGILESYGLGTAIKDFTIPEGNQPDEFGIEDAMGYVSPLQRIYPLARDIAQHFVNTPSKPLGKEEYEKSPYFRTDVPWDEAMTEARAAALAINYDARRVREFYTQKRPITSFFGNIAGQAFDPINYVPVAGPLVRASAVARLGRIRGGMAIGSGDAALNTAVFGLGTAEQRGRYGEDVSWQALATEISMAALIGAAFGGGAGYLSHRRALADEERLNTIRNVQESRIALNEAIDGIANDGEVNLSPNAVDPIVRVQGEGTGFEVWHGSPHDFDKFDMSKIGSGEGSQIYGHGLYFGEERAVGEEYKDVLAYKGYSYNRERFLTESELSGQIKKHYGTDSNIDYDLIASVVVDEIDVDKGFFRNKLNDREAAIANELRGKVSETQPGTLYKVRINADPDEFVDFDKPLNEQSEKIQSILGTKGIGKEALSKFGQRMEGASPAEISKALLDKGIPGIKYLDQGSRDAGDGTRNYVLFDDALAQIVQKNGVDVSPPRPDPIPEGRTEAEARVVNIEDYKAMAEQYRVDPETGAFDEEPEIQQLVAEGKVTEAEKAELEAAQETYEDGVSFGEALKAAVNCII